jgi:hypothetical protein
VCCDSLAYLSYPSKNPSISCYLYLDFFEDVVIPVTLELEKSKDSNLVASVYIFNSRGSNPGFSKKVNDISDNVLRKAGKTIGRLVNQYIVDNQSASQSDITKHTASIVNQVIPGLAFS